MVVRVELRVQGEEGGEAADVFCEVERFVGCERALEEDGFAVTEPFLQHPILRRRRASSMSVSAESRLLFTPAFPRAFPRGQTFLRAPPVAESHLRTWGRHLY